MERIKKINKIFNATDEELKKIYECETDLVKIQLENQFSNFFTRSKKITLSDYEKQIFPIIQEIVTIDVLCLHKLASKEEFETFLSENNINFTDMHLYRTETDNSKQELLNLCLNDTDYVILSSGSAARAFFEMADTSNVKLISIGNETTKSAEKCGLKIYKTADNATAESIIDCIRRDTK